MLKRKHIIIAAAALLLAACKTTPVVIPPGTTPEGGPTPNASQAASSFEPAYDPLASEVPLPNDLVFLNQSTGKSDSQTLDLPLDGASPTDLGSPYVAMDQIDGWSTMSPIQFQFNQAIDPSSINPQDVRVYEAKIDSNAHVTSIVSKLTQGVDYQATVAGYDPDILVVKPLKPLQASTPSTRYGYVALVTNGLQNTQGQNAMANLAYATFSSQHVNNNNQVEPAREIVASGLAAAQTWEANHGGSLNLDNVVDSTNFTTESTLQPYLEVLNNGVHGTPGSNVVGHAWPTWIQLSANGTSLGAATCVQYQQVISEPATGCNEQLTTGFAHNGNSDVKAGADVFDGTIDNVPYYLGIPTGQNASEPLGPQPGGGTNFVESETNAAVTSEWVAKHNATSTSLATPVTRFNPMPVETTTQMPGSADYANGTKAYPDPGATGSGSQPGQVPAAGTVDFPVVVTLPNGSAPTGSTGCSSTDSGTPPSGGWPVVIFVHDLTRNRGDDLALAGQLGQQCYATIAIDLPLHGLTAHYGNAATYDLFKRFPALERHFWLNMASYADNSGEAQTGSSPDSIADPPGIHLLNPTYMLNFRDNVRQAVSDLMYLYKAMGSMTIYEPPQGNTTCSPSGGALTATCVANTFDMSKVYVVGMGLGGMVGSIFTSVENHGATSASSAPIKGAALNAFGGDWADLLDGSPAIGPKVVEGVYQATRNTSSVAARGQTPGAYTYEQFKLLLQTAMSPADPLAFVSDLNTQGTPTFLSEFAGNWTASSGGNHPDLDFPNNTQNQADYNHFWSQEWTGLFEGVYYPSSPPFPISEQLALTSPLAGTEPFAMLNNEQKLTQAQTYGTASCAPFTGGIHAYSAFTAGYHGSLLDDATGQSPQPQTSTAVTQELQSEILSFLNSNGCQVTVSSASNLQQ